MLIHRYNLLAEKRKQLWTLLVSVTLWCTLIIVAELYFKAKPLDSTKGGPAPPSNGPQPTGGSPPNRPPLPPQEHMMSGPPPPMGGPPQPMGGLPLQMRGRPPPPPFMNRPPLPNICFLLQI